jgi:hypothetical protein
LILPQRHGAEEPSAVIARSKTGPAAIETKMGCALRRP